MSLETRIIALAQAIGTDIKALASDKQAALVSGTTIKTVNGISVMGSGNLTISGFYNADGGAPTTVYGGTTPLQGGTP